MRYVLGSMLLLLALLITAGCGSDSDEDLQSPGSFTMYIDTSYDGASTASLEERIHAAAIVVRANLASTGNGTLTFDAVEYLKGTGPTRFTLEAPESGRTTRWDSREALLFLDGPVTEAPAGDDSGVGGSSTGGPPRYAFADTTSLGDGRYDYQGALPEGNSIETRNPVWMPSTATGGAGGAAGGSAQESDPSFIIETQSPYGERNPTISLSDLKSLIAWIGGGDGDAAYESCVEQALRTERAGRDVAVYYGTPWEPDTITASLPSSAPAGTAVDQYGGGENHTVYEKRALTGADAGLFRVRLVDADSDPSNGYTFSFENTRPLPAGTYKFKSYIQSHFFLACDYRDSPLVGLNWEVEVEEAPAWTVLEALFDPQTIGSGDGYISSGDVSTGDLGATDFTVVVGNVSTSITALTGDASNVTLSLDPYHALDSYTLEVITGDGTASVSLTGDAATGDSSEGTLTWDVGSKPWSSGDELMLRITVAPDDPAERTRSDNAAAEGFCDDAVNVYIYADPVDDNLLIDCEALIDGVLPLSNVGQTRWNPGSGMDRQRGVSIDVVDGVLRVTGVDLTDVGLAGAFPAPFAKVETLTSLKLSGNTFTGCIPRFLYYVDDHDLNSLGLEPCE